MPLIFHIDPSILDIEKEICKIKKNYKRSIGDVLMARKERGCESYALMKKETKKK